MAARRKHGHHHRHFPHRLLDSEHAESRRPCHSPQAGRNHPFSEKRAQRNDSNRTTLGHRPGKHQQELRKNPCRMRAAHRKEQGPCLEMIEASAHVPFAFFPRIPGIGAPPSNCDAATISSCNPFLCKSSEVRNFTCRMFFPEPSSKPSGSGSDVANGKPNVTCFLATM